MSHSLKHHSEFLLDVGKYRKALCSILNQMGYENSTSLAPFFPLTFADRFRHGNTSWQVFALTIIGPRISRGGSGVRGKCIITKLLSRNPAQN